MVLANTFVPDTRVRREARALSNYGYKVKILCWDRQGTRPTQEVVENCLVTNLKFGRGTVLAESRVYFVISAILFQFAILLSAIRTLRQSKALILHAHDFNTLVGSAFVKLFFPVNMKLVYDSHEFTPGIYMEWYGTLVSRAVTIIERFSLRFVNRAIGANDAISKYLGGFATSESVSIYTCPDLKEVPPVSQAEARKRFGYGSEFIILFSGRVRQDYDFDLVTEAAHRLLQQGLTSKYKFVFTGPEETTATITTKVELEHLQCIFDFRGWIPYNDLLLLYKASSVCFAVAHNIGPNSRILTPIKLFESLSCGLPVLVRKGTLAEKIVSRYGCGVVVDGNQESFFDALVSLADSQKMLQSLGEAGRSAFIKVFNWKVMEHRLLKVYESLYTES